MMKTTITWLALTTWGQWGHGPQSQYLNKYGAIQTQQHLVIIETVGMVVFIVSFTIVSWGEWNWSERNKKPGSVPPSLRRSHPQMSHIYMSDPRALKAVKMLIRFRWRARRYVGGSSCSVLLKLYVNPQVTGLLNKSRDDVPVRLTYLDVS